MIKRLWLVFSALVMATVLAACGEKIQTTSSPKKADAKAWQGADDPFVAPGWQAGDRTSWENQLRTRNQAQNEYNKVQ
ncbi:hypothetical protein [Piscinibacter sp.]|uniref:hypothetical protein n=1 Tax=Piscinibacter sp. TaxID=1903157 RepID=UPI00391F9E51